MNAKVEAKKLINKFKNEVNRFTGGEEIHNILFSKECAMICVDQIIKALENEAHGEVWSLESLMEKIEFWKKVQIEITNYKERK